MVSKIPRNAIIFTFVTFHGIKNLLKLCWFELLRTWRAQNGAALSASSTFSHFNFLSKNKIC
jgi:hypothetical protein